MAKGLQIRHGIGQRLRGLGTIPSLLGGLADLLEGIAQSRSFRPPAAFSLGRRSQHAFGQKLQAPPVFHQHLASQQVHGLDAVRAFVDHVEAVVAPVLLHRKVAGVAVATVDLDGQAVGFQAPLAGETLDDGREHLQQQTRHICVFRRAGVLFIHQAGAVQGQGQSALAVGLLGQQHALDVGVFDDAHLRAAGILAPCPCRSALRAVLGVIEAGVVTRHTQHGSGHAHADARFVHHMEHAAQAFAGLADQISYGTASGTVQACACFATHGVLALAKVQQRVGRAAPAAFVVEARQRHVVALAGELPIGADHLFGHDEERDAFDARHQLAVGIGDLGQHQVDDVFGEFVLARGNPHLVAAQAVTRTQSIDFKAFTIGRGAGRHIAQRRTGLRFAQAHGARKTPIEFVGGKDLLLQIGAMHHQQIGVAAGQHARANADRGHGKKGIGSRLHRVGQLHATDLVVLCGAQHARFGIGFVRIVCGLRQDDFFAIKVGFLRVHQAVERGVFFASNALAGVQHRIKSFA